jgi:hypothetical protein
MLPCVNNVALSGETPSYNILILAWTYFVTNLNVNLVVK